MGAPLLSWQQQPSRQVQVPQRKQRQRADRILVQPSIAHFGEAPQVLNDLKRVLAVRAMMRSPMATSATSWPSDLLRQLCLLALAQIRSAVTAATNSADTPREQLRALINAHLQTDLADCHLHVTQKIEMRSLSDKSRAQIVGLRNEYEEIVLNLIRSAQRTNEISSEHGPVSFPVE